MLFMNIFFHNVTVAVLCLFTFTFTVHFTFFYFLGQPITCVACDKQYRISDYDGNYEVIGEKKAVKFVENSVNNKIESVIKEEKTKKNADPEPEPEFLSPLFDMSDAPILDFSSFSSVSEDPSLLISKVQFRLYLILLHFERIASLC
jgi:hypothetical protein